MRKRMIQWLIIIIGISLIINLSRDILRLIKAGEQIKLTEEQLVEKSQEKNLLLEKKKYYTSQEFIEEEARNKLNMAKPGETIVVLPQNVSELVGREKKEALQEFPCWQKWWHLFF